MNLKDLEALYYQGKNMAGGLLSMIPAGYGGLYELARTGNPYMASDFADKVQGQFLTAPETTEEKASDYAMQQAGKLIEPIDRAVQDASEYVQYLNPVHGLLSDEQQAANSAMTYAGANTLLGGLLGKSLMSGAKMGNSVKRNFGQSGTIAGRGAKTANLELLKKAEKMKADGVDADTIYKETQWWLDHPDGQPRFEIDDSDFVFNEAYLMPPKQRMLNDAEKLKKEGKEHEAWILERENRDLSDFGEYSVAPALYSRHGLLNEAYPDVMWHPLTPNDSVISNAYFDGQGYGMSVFADNPKSSMLHEFQHAVQRNEGFGGGGSTALFKNEMTKRKQHASRMIDSANARMRRAYDDMESWKDPMNIDLYGDDYVADRISEAKAQYDKAMSERAKYVNDASIDLLTDPYDSYRKLAGESEARLTQDRMNMPMSARLADPFYKHYDVPFEEMIIKREGLLK